MLASCALSPMDIKFKYILFAIFQRWVQTTSTNTDDNGRNRSWHTLAVKWLLNFLDLSAEWCIFQHFLRGSQKKLKTYFVPRFFCRTMDHQAINSLRRPLKNRIEETTAIAGGISTRAIGWKLDSHRNQDTAVAVGYSFRKSFDIFGQLVISQV